MIITIAYTLFIYILGFITNMNDKKARMRYLIISGIILVLISGLRSYYIGSGDTFRYSLMFEEDVAMSFQEILQSGIKDPWYHVFSKLLSLVLGNNFTAILTVFATMFIVAYGILVQKESPNLLLSFIVFISMGFFSFSMHGVRQSMGIAFVMLSYFPLKERKLLLFVVLVFIASCFHKSAAIFLVAYPFSMLGFNKKSFFLYFLLILIFILNGDVLVRQFATEVSVYDERFADYATTEKSLTNSGFIQLLLFLGFTLYYYKYFSYKDKDCSTLTVLLVLAIIFQTFAIFIAEMFRVAMYFSIFLVILVPRVIESIPLQNRKLITVIICGLLLFYFYSIPYKLEYDFYWND